MERSYTWGLASAPTLFLAACTMIGSPQIPDPPASAVRSPEARPTVEPPSRGGNMVEYEQGGHTYRVLESSYGYDRQGIASWYGAQFHGRATSSGEPFDMNALSAAHRTLPLPSWIRVTNLANGRSLLLRVNDRGPFADPDRRILDVSYAAARRLGMVDAGTTSVRVESVEPWQSRTRRQTR